MSSKKPMPSVEELIRAEKQIFTGVYWRLFARYASRFAEGYASYLALAVTRYLLSYPDGDEQAKMFHEQNRNQIDQEILALRKDPDIRRVVTDTLVIKAVFQHRKGGCGKDDALALVENLKKLGLYQEGSHPPTPGSFVRMASAFFSETPVRVPIPAPNT
ncbi:MAG TPA: hypothetical protein PLA83_04555 [Deltaproteobacteria bacterium]|jgi:hypothetical protein|nr:hypothetical protein [Deltaproteobacteria bacterium]HQI02863.1 hypothetical protein [Deltaproteobacteria bacterium]